MHYPEVVGRKKKTGIMVLVISRTGPQRSLLPITADDVLAPDDTCATVTNLGK